MFNNGTTEVGEVLTKKGSLNLSSDRAVHQGFHQSPKHAMDSLMIKMLFWASLSGLNVALFQMNVSTICFNLSTSNEIWNKLADGLAPTRLKRHTVGQEKGT